MTKAMRKLADKHALIFWILCVLIFVVGYKFISVGLLGSTPYEYDVAFFKLSLALLAILMMKTLYQGQFCFHFRKDNFLKALILQWPALLFVLANLLSPGSLSENAIVPETLVMVLVANMITGFYEEVIMRGMLLGHMMEHWKNDDRKILKSVLTTSILFGLVHLGNLVQAGLISTLFQVCYATIFGLIFAVAYLRTKNLWACVLIHGLADVSGEMYTIYYVPGAEIPSFAGVGLLMILLCTVICLIVALFEFRKKKRTEILELWRDDMTCSVA